MATTIDTPSPAAQRQFNKLFQRIFDYAGLPSIELRQQPGRLNVIAVFGHFRIQLGAFVGDEVDAVLRIAMQARVRLPGGRRAPAVVAAFKALEEDSPEALVEPTDEVAS